MDQQTSGHPIGRQTGARVFFPAAMTAAAMGFFFAVYPTFVTVGPNLAPPPGEPAHARTASAEPAWKPSPAFAALQYSNPSNSPVFTTRSDGATRGSWTLVLTQWPAAVAFRIYAHAGCDAVTRGSHTWEFARLTSYCIDQTGRGRFDWPHIVFNLDGTRPERLYEKQLLIPPGAQTAVVAVANAGLSGVLRVRDVDIRTVIRNPANRFWIPFWALVWAGTFLWCLSLIRPFRTSWERIMLVFAFIAIGGAIVPSQWIKGIRWKSNRAIEWVEARLTPPAPPPVTVPAERPADTNRTAAAVTPSPPRPPSAPPAPQDLPRLVEFLQLKAFHDIGHLAVYSMLGLAACLAYRRSGVPTRIGAGRIVTALVLFAVATEMLQFLTTTRSPSWLNAGTNLIGLTMGLLAFLATRPFTRLTSNV